MTYLSRCMKKFAETTTVHGPSHTVQSKYTTGKVLWVMLTITMASLGVAHSFFYIRQFVRLETGSNVEVINFDDQKDTTLLNSLAYCPQDWLNYTAFMQSNVPKKALLYGISLIPSVDPYVFAQLRSIPDLISQEDDIFKSETGDTKWTNKAGNTTNAELAYISDGHLADSKKQFHEVIERSGLKTLKEFLAPYVNAMNANLDGIELAAAYKVEATDIEIRFGRVCKVFSVSAVDDATRAALPPILSGKVMYLTASHATSRHTLFPIRVDISPFTGDIGLNPMQDVYSNKVMGLKSSSITLQQADEGIVLSPYHYQTSRKKVEDDCHQSEVPRQETRKVLLQTCQNRCIHMWLQNSHITDGCRLISSVDMNINGNFCMVNDWSFRSKSDKLMNKSFVQTCYAEKCTRLSNVCEEFSISFLSPQNSADLLVEETTMLLDTFGRWGTGAEQRQWLHVVQLQMSGFSLVVTQFRLLRFSAMMASIGGTMGLCVGASFISSIHFFLFWCRALFGFADLDEEDHQPDGMFNYQKQEETSITS